MTAQEGPTQQQLQQEETLKESLRSAGISFKAHRHPKACTVEELITAVGHLGIPVCKNLFLKDKKGSLFLLTALHDSPTPLKGLMMKLGVQKLRLADEKTLEASLLVLPGCVTPFAILNDEKKAVTFLLDAKLKDSEKMVLVHPLHNFESLEIAARDIISFLISKGVAIDFVDCQGSSSLAAYILTLLAAGSSGAADPHLLHSPAVYTASAELQALSEAPAESSNGAAAGKKSGVAAKSTKEESQQQEATLGMTAKKATNFAEWYTQAIVRGELVEYYDISGCYIIRPWAYRMWEVVQRFFDDSIKRLGVENCYFPMFVSQAKLEREKDHVEGFKPEVAWVTHYGESELPEKVAIRPTSETIMYPAYAKWIRSHRDLPLKLNQWNNVVRWEFKQPTPFLRTREFLWQEGHTAHASEEEAFAQVLDILELYRQWYEDYLAVPVIKGEKSENEKFAGGKMTTTIEGIIPETGRGIQAATSHLLGQNFSKMFGIEFEDEKGAKQLVHQTSWGCTTRSLGVMIMTHGDDKGLVLPPRIVAVQAVIIPIIFKEKGGSEIVAKCRELEKTLAAAGVRVKVDDRTNYTPGWKFNDWELKGVPLRLEIGPRDVENCQTRVVRRDTSEARNVPWAEAGSTIPAMLETMQKDLFTRAKERFDASIEKITSFEEVMPVLNRRHIVLAPCECCRTFVGRSRCEDPDTETQIKKETQRLSEMQARENTEGMTGAMKSLCIPFEQPPMPEGTRCFFTGRPAKRWYFGRAHSACGVVKIKAAGVSDRACA
ncbi:prolyl-tRNA synthetase, putative [Eimeria maxima]|uniref:proline--tRNA ligase n=1 Tax=Eimeria maxima TaxID=5804 RepID=U6M6F5_EIMMA|nr:prolyl-tRNA synthetase, putative [Eimeria maxima]CDJ59817.1 prolyl-tRNA synthetase, putative [Eimeria maxima]